MPYVVCVMSPSAIKDSSRLASLEEHFEEKQTTSFYKSNGKKESLCAKTCYSPHVPIKRSFSYQSDCMNDVLFKTSLEVMYNPTCL